VYADNGNEIRDKLKEQTGEKHVPIFFLQGTHMPSEQLIAGLKGQGRTAPIRARLEAAGLQVNGYFRL
jgi:glutaredoxin